MQLSFALPRWQVGDEWEFRWESPTGKGTYVRVIDRIEKINGIEHYVMKSGRRPEHVFRASDLTVTHDTVDGQIDRRAIRPDLVAMWPLAVGRRWDDRYASEWPKDRSSREYSYQCRVDGQEHVSVPAGRFNAFKVTCVEQRSDHTHERWWAPEAKYYVRERSEQRNGMLERELIRYRVK